MLSSLLGNGLVATAETSAQSTTQSTPAIVTNWFALFISVLIIICFVLLIVFTRRYRFEAKVIAEIGVACALALVLGYLKILQLPQGGTISLAMVPVIIVALRRGVVAGVVTGVISGMLMMLPDPFLVHPVQVILDYPLAWGALGFAGLIAEKKHRTKILLAVEGLFLALLVFFVLGLTTNITQAWFGSRLENATLGWDKYAFIAIVLAFVLPTYLVFRKGVVNKIGSIFIGAFGRFFFHFIAGVFFFWMFIEYWQGFSLFGYVSIYIAMHLIPETIISILASLPIIRMNILEQNE